MLKLSLTPAGKTLRLLCLGAHSDDLEIGCGGTVLQWLASRPVDVCWVVLSAAGPRADEARRSANALLRRARNVQVVLHEFDDGRFPAYYTELKAALEAVKRSMQPDLILTHRLEDRHQDHRTVAELTWQTWRDHLIVEYEIPKYEGDLGHPNWYVPLTGAAAKRKVDHLMRHFATQRSKSWFAADTFNSLMHLRAVECRAPSGFAEAFTARKLVV